ncbi:uncharacterized protein LOC110981299 [Acanthaster planci]|uniref:Uncharacterized protein LOC110981299 n=1 Tax=Acanthaster planci TaxID=133434 RepID=A0A8B7YMK4_ACAPL|nr:uncharacterized protein LOC110981299 [Acanthaster planci]XP_022094480.1 uncharacterized protein LOC110981299 [Acanthaster planci]XP_022094489.1 uncharacterized protein LOC110981299 [Acanthaster planci]XP_022094498.1 uncharacterized protein LOC110981299 [Acanthaster planci]XP_022094506.1 uncharacterized protein LOC110981299 [Acanthaster planci]
MATLQKASKRPWGTITKPDHMGLGHQRLTAYEVEQSVNRLYYVPKARDAKYNRQNPKMTSTDIRKMVERLTSKPTEKVPDSKRVPEGKLREIGILNSFAWKGYN